MMVFFSNKARENKFGKNICKCESPTLTEQMAF